MSSDIIIIGGGVIGLLTAREFINAGATVTIIEKNEFGQESSWAGGGILLPLYPWRQSQAITDLVIHSLKLYPELAAQLIDDAGVDPEWTPCGMLITKNPDISSAVDWCRKSHISFYDVLPEGGIGLNAVTDHPLWLPDIAQVRNPRLIKSLIQDLSNKGVKFLEHCSLSDIAIAQNRVIALNTSAGRLAVNQLVIAAGAWTGQLFRQYFSKLITKAPEVTPVKGQMILFDATPDTLPYMVLDGDQYLIPRRDGKILVGSTVETDEFNKTITPEARDKLWHFAVELLPALADFPVIRHWAGLRPGTEHGIPYIGKHPEIANLSVNAGHFRNGLAMGPASAQLLVDIVLERSTTIVPDPYQISRRH
ncbi:MAG: glycine oxidase ThiO [Methylococcaceae bacterium]|nr:glycine oxidase ThiO [Methylococcaceae bacterium]